MFVKRLTSLLFVVSALCASETPYWIFLEFEASSSEVKLTACAEQRLVLRGSETPSGKYEVSESHLDQLRSAGYRIRHASRFLNAVSVIIDNPDQLSELERLSFVRSITPVAQHPRDGLEPISTGNQLVRGSTLAYGASSSQNEMLNIPQIHDLGYDGTGILVGVFDTGFLTEHPAFDNLDILAQYDFIDQEVDASGPGHEHGINDQHQEKQC